METRIGKNGRAYPVKSLEERFKAKYVEGAPNDCWNWLAATDKAGYGVINVCPSGKASGKMQPAHRLALILATGVEGEVAMHLCDNPSCVNPAHLKWGTQQDNVADRVSKGRSGLPGAKLTKEQVQTIRATFNGDYELFQNTYSISRLTLHRIITKQSWKNV